MKTINAKRTFSLPIAFGACVLSLMLVLFGLPLSPAFAVTSAEKQEEHDAIMLKIDSLQTELNAANEDYETALAENKAATDAMNAAQVRIEEAEVRINDLQERLGTRVNSMYKQGSLSFIDVLFEASTFENFLTSLDMIDRINSQDAELVQETKDARVEAQAARDEYASQKEKAAEEMAKAEELASQIEANQSSLREEAKKMTAEIAELKAQEELEAEAARQAKAASEAEQAKINSSSSSSSGSSDSSGSGSAGSSTIVGNGQFAHPCPGGSETSQFGWRAFTGTFHQGLDYGASAGTSYYAAESGTVIYASYDGGYNGGAGNWVVIAHGNGLVTKYMHSTKVFVSVGQTVSKGQNIGTVGNTGHSYGAHLHFQVERNGTAIDPKNYL